MEQVPDPQRTWRDLSERGLIFLRDEHQEMASEFGLSDDKVYRHIEVTGDTTSPLSYKKNEYEFIVGPRCSFVINSRRHDGPHWSEIGLAVYRYYQREELEWVFQLNVINEETNQVVQEDLYTEHQRLLWPDITPQAWLYGQQEFTAVLGTPNIHGVAAMVLGGFPDRNKTIREVYTWASPIGNWLQMAVHITDVERPVVEESVVEEPAQPES